MPELPEVETTCQGIKPHLLHQTIQQVIIRETRLRWPVNTQIKKTLCSQNIISISRRAKYILIQVSKGYLIIHLGMSGTLRIITEKTDIKKHDHFDCVLENGTTLRFNDPRRFGSIQWAEDFSTFPLIANLGPEPLGKDFNKNYLYQKAKNHRIPIKNLIMNNHIVVGVGNIYASESLFLAGIHPQMASNQLTLNQASVLVKAISSTLKKAIAHGGTTLKNFTQSDGKPGYFGNKLKVYDRKDEPCFNCHSPIQSLRLGQRMTFYCLKCQT